MLFAVGADLVAHTEEAFQRMINKFSQANKDLGLTITFGQLRPATCLSNQNGADG